MRKKVGTLLDVNLAKEMKERAREKHTTLNRILEEALSEYFSRHISSKQGVSAVETSFGVVNLPLKTLREIIREEIYET